MRSEITNVKWDGPAPNGPCQPIVRWAGSKRQLVSHLSTLIPSQYGRYVEPFCGSACLFLAIGPTQAVLSDVNPHLIKTYSVVRSHPREVSELLARWRATKEKYLKLRTAGLSDNLIWNAARFLFLNRLCFNGVYRENRAGVYNVPFSGIRVGPMPGFKELAAFAARSQAAEFRCDDFETVINEAKTDDFVYLDPPYTYSGQRNRGEYGTGAFNEDDIERLLGCLRAADKRGVKLLLSYNKLSDVSKKFPRWKVTYASVRRSVAGFAVRRRTVREFQFRNYER